MAEILTFILDVLVDHAGLILFTLLSVAITIYLLYVLLHPESF